MQMLDAREFRDEPRILNFKNSGLVPEFPPQCCGHSVASLARQATIGGFLNTRINELFRRDHGN